MKTLIVYASKYGCTEDCAKYLKDKISGGVTLVDINKSADLIELNNLDAVIIGGSVYVSKVSKKLRAFCESNLEILTKKKIGIFLCCALSEQAGETMKTNFPPALLKAAKAAMPFGSQARLEKMSFLDKTILKAVSKGDYSSFKISYESMDEFARLMTQ